MSADQVQRSGNRQRYMTIGDVFEDIQSGELYRLVHLGSWAGSGIHRHEITPGPQVWLHKVSAETNGKDTRYCEMLPENLIKLHDTRDVWKAFQKVED